MSDDIQDIGPVSKDAQASEQATRWFAVMHSDACTEQDVCDHQAWLKGNPVHEQEYQAVEQMWDLLGSFAEKPEIVEECQHVKPPLDELARHGNVKLQQEITQLQQKSNRLQQLSARLQREAQKELASTTDNQSPAPSFFSRYAVAASVLIIALSSGLMFQDSWFKNSWDRLFNHSVYQTAVGEQRTFYLSDGSSVVLDTQTTITTSFSDDSRNVVLENGQARFNVVRDEQRPFMVKAGNGNTTALGTAFIVRKSEEAIRVTLIEGKIAVTQDKAQLDDALADFATHGSPAAVSVREEILLQQGQEITYSSKGLSEATIVDVEKATAWQQGRLIFEDYSLREVLDELNRYSNNKIVLGDNSLASIRVTGVFRSGDNRKAIEALKTYFSMQVTTDLQGNLVLLQKQNSSMEH